MNNSANLERLRSCDILDIFRDFSLFSYILQMFFIKLNMTSIFRKKSLQKYPDLTDFFSSFVQLLSELITGTKYRKKFFAYFAHTFRICKIVLK